MQRKRKKGRKNKEGKKIEKHNILKKEKKL
jgi:hypothetical protein